MFERYTERARRVIFFARYEASQFGSPTIETEHLLLSLIREDKSLTSHLLRNSLSIESILDEIKARITIREKIPTSIDLPLSDECKRILAYAAKESADLDHRHIGTEHLLLAVLLEDNCLAAQILTGRGLRLDAIRDELRPVVDGQTLLKPRNPALPEAGVVPDADTAIQIAEAIWRSLYGLEAVEKQRPYKAELQSGGVWLVTGTPAAEETEPLSTFILRADGRILAIGRAVN